MFAKFIVPDNVAGAGSTAANVTDKTPDVRDLEWGRKTVRRLIRKLGISDRTENSVSQKKGVGAGRGKQ